MKSGMVLALCMIAAVVFGGIMITNAVDTASERCIAAANEIGVLVRMNAWERAEAVCGDYAEQWKKSRALLDLVTLHETLDDVSDAYEELGTGIEFRNAEYCAEKCSALMRGAEALRESERITLENIL